MGHLYFVRHGESQWNVINKICGATDIPLTDKGHHQAEETGKAILAQGIKADMILYSPLQRAADTARHISAMTGIPCRAEERLKEQNFGKYEGTARDGKAFHQAKQNFLCSYEGGESMMRVGQRIYNLLDEIRKENRVYILVAHNGIARIVHSYFFDMTNEEFAGHGIRNCEIAEYHWE